MRNSDYTVFNGVHLELTNIRDDDERVLLSYKGGNCPLSGFKKSAHRIDTYVLIVDLKTIDNAYQVRTYGKYKGFIFSVFSINVEASENTRITTSDAKVGKLLNLLETPPGWFIDDIHESELEKIWEEHTPTRGLPMPKGLEKIKIIKE